MSQDLFEAFSWETKAANKPQQQSSASFDFFGDFTSSTVQSSSIEPNPTKHQASNWNTTFNPSQNEDDWGDFEGSAAGNALSNQNEIDSMTAQAAGSVHDHRTNLNPSLSTTNYSKERESPFTAFTPAQTTATRDSNVLFDADDDVPSEEEAEDDDDDFGAFEGPGAVVSSPKRSVDLLGLDMGQLSPIVPKQKVLARENDLFGLDEVAEPPIMRSSTIKFQPTDPASQMYDTRKSEERSPGLITVASSKPAFKGSKQPAKPKAVEQDEPWDDFGAWDDTSAPSDSKSGSKDAVTLPPTISTAPVAADELPPRNIPPPAVLLATFPPIFLSAENDVFKPVSTQSQSAREKIFTDPKTIEFLKSYILLSVVCARVIAGRKSRWKRDTLLAQSMRIGPATSGKLGGMKVTSLDKAEATREDREVADVLRAWQRQVGRLKAAVADVKKGSGLDLGAVPDIRDTMPTRIANELDGGVRSSKPCGLCGLKREERVGKVDVDVQDSFGEWWIENASMHRGMDTFATNGSCSTLTFESMQKFLGRTRTHTQTTLMLV